MRKSFKVVIALILVFSVAVTGLQLNWLVSSYGLAKKNYKLSLDKCLGTASVDYSAIMVSALPKKVNQIPRVYVIGAMDHGLPVVSQLSGEGRNVNIQSRGNLVVDTLADYYAKGFWVDVMDRNAFNIKLFDSCFRAALIKTGLKEADYILDTAHIKGSLTGIIDYMANKTYKDHPVQTWGIYAGGMFSNIMIWASCKAYPPFLYNQLLWIVLASVFIILVVNAGLFFILRTFYKQRQLTALKNDFISNMTHELKTPVSVITTVIDAILEHKVMVDKEKLLNYLSMAREETEVLSNRIEKVLDIAKDEHNFKMHPETIDLRELVDAVVEKHRLLPEKDVTFLVEGAPITIQADRLHFAGMLSNLIENAVKYAGEKPVITIEYGMVHNRLRLRVADNGIGIVKKYQPYVFDKFFRVPTGNIHTVKGSGLGLSYVKSIVEKHGGTITVESTPGKGSTFTISILL